MRPRNHVRLLALGLATWALFWVLGLPDYYQQYPTWALAVGTVLLTLGTGFVGRLVLARARPERRMERAAWLSFYFTVPFAALDAAYCGWYLGRGAAFLVEYWYLSVFYVIPWALFLPIGAMLGTRASARD